MGQIIKFDFEKPSWQTLVDRMWENDKFSGEDLLQFLATTIHVRLCGVMLGQEISVETVGECNRITREFLHYTYQSAIMNHIKNPIIPDLQIVRSVSGSNQLLICEVAPDGTIIQESDS